MSESLTNEITIFLEILRDIVNLSETEEQGVHMLDMDSFLEKIDQEIEFLLERDAYILLGCFSLLREGLKAVGRSRSDYSPEPPPPPCFEAEKLPGRNGSPDWPNSWPSPSEWRGVKGSLDTPLPPSPYSGGVGPSKEGPTINWEDPFPNDPSTEDLFDILDRLILDLAKAGDFRGVSTLVNIRAHYHRMIFE
jgi:hypothetical protein